ncbi:tyrosine-type recombinase/integrase [Desulfolutivibrio sulfoxidireducens]|uniref:tyrosine-type recombinase/integrase n=1 Tax=Desulfolutivibrio sulfoxidireducens TaxID=2773299 RepID=UPI00159E420F|nr:tyrosine-type recombinase/integrase [Desulfolutivibrio sulfoxidireducens]
MQATALTGRAPAAFPVPVQAKNDARLIALWLHGKGGLTRKAYARDVAAFLAFAAKPVHAVTLGDVQAWIDALVVSGLKRSSQGVKLAVVKSLLSFAHKLGYCAFNTGAAARAPKGKADLNARILSEAEVFELFAQAKGRDRTLLRFLYATGARCAEASGLTWADFNEDGKGGVTVSVWGKGEKLRHISIPAKIWGEVRALRRDGDGPASPVFRSRQGGPVSRSQIWRIVRTAAAKAGTGRDVSPHWLRHACASHALDRGAPIHVVQSSLGHSSLATTTAYCHARPGVGVGHFLGV